MESPLDYNGCCSAVDVVCRLQEPLTSPLLPSNKLLSRSTWACKRVTSCCFLLYCSWRGAS
jgi:hypothetical protein